MNRHILFLLSAAAVVLLAGCGRPSVGKLPYDKLSSKDFVAVVNGVGYTKGELERDVALTERILTLAGLPQEEMVSRREPSVFRRSVINGFVARELLLNEAKRRRLDLSSEEMNRYQNRFAAELSGKMPLTFPAVLEALGRDATAFRNNLKKDALSAKVETVLRNQLSAAIPAPDARDLERQRQAALQANRQIEKDNRSLFRLATNAWKSIRAGNDFAVVGRKLPSLHAGISYEPAAKDDSGRFASVRPGTLLPPEAIDGGLRIVKVSVSADGSRQLSALLFKSAPLQEVPAADAQADALRQKAVGAKYAELLRQLRKSAEISTISI